MLTFERFCDWLSRWNKMEYEEEKIGMLHILQENKWSFERYREPIIFLLETADGYRGHEPKTKVAKKAFQVLCLKFFKSGNDNHHSNYWWWMVEDDLLFEKVLWFLRPCEFWNQNYKLEENPEHPEGIFQGFLRSFAKMGWNFQEQQRINSDDSMTQEAMERIIAARPQFIEIMQEMRQLMWLVKQDLDEACLQKLLELALGREDYDLPKEEGGSRGRKPTTLEEAVWSGSHAAYVLVLHKTRQDQQKIFDAQAEERRHQHEEKERKENLARILKQQEILTKKVAELAG